MIVTQAMQESEFEKLIDKLNNIEYENLHTLRLVTTFYNIDFIFFVC